MPVSPEPFELLGQILTGGGYKETKFLSSVNKKEERLQERCQTNEPEMWPGEGSHKLTQQFVFVWWATDCMCRLE